MSKGIIYNVQPFSVHDGPGIRTTVFFKGCNLRCAWCHNPESWSGRPELQFYPEKCVGCGACFTACPAGVHRVEDAAGSGHVLLRERCIGCGLCADTCYAGALVLAGKELEGMELYRLLEKDLPYFRQGGGGVTFSGGECMLQPEFLLEMLQRCREGGIHTAVDTAGQVPWRTVEEIAPWTDLFLYDLKGWDAGLHRALTGVSNEGIRENLDRLLERGARVIVRIPCVAGGNWEDLPPLAEFLAGKPVELVELLAYHRLGEGKFDTLGMEGSRELGAPSGEEMEELAERFRQRGIPVKYTKQV